MKSILSVFFSIVLFSISSFAGEKTAPDEAVAKVNGAVITSRELESEIDALIPRSVYHRDVSEEKRSEFRKKALNELIDRELLFQDARSRAVKADGKAVQAQIDQIRSRFKSKKEYRSALDQAGLSENELRRQVEKSLTIQSAIEKTAVEPAKMSEAELKNYYDTNTEKFKQPESIRLRIITVSDENKAKSVMGRIRAGEDFGVIAGTASEDNLRIMGGDTGYVHGGRLEPAIENAAAEMKPGETRGPIRADGKWFIIRLEDKKPAHQMSFAESRDKLKNELESKRADDLKEKWISGLRAKAVIEIIEK